MILGCDPGLDGALALYDGRELLLFDMPTEVVMVNRRERRAVWPQGAIVALKTYALMGAEILVIEQVSGMPGQSGPAAFTFGFGVGIVTAAALAAGLKFERVHPSTWKAALGVPADKAAARRIAAERFPESAAMFTRVKDDGRAEAALIALWGQMTRGRP